MGRGGGLAGAGGGVGLVVFKEFLKAHAHLPVSVWEPLLVVGDLKQGIATNILGRAVRGPPGYCCRSLCRRYHTLIALESQAGDFKARTHTVCHTQQCLTHTTAIRTTPVCVCVCSCSTSSLVPVGGSPTKKKKVVRLVVKGAYCA